MHGVLAEGDVWDVKFPLVVLPYECVRSPSVKEGVQATVAKLIKWSLECAASGVFPEQGFMGETLLGKRSEWAGKPCGGSWTPAYFGYRFDLKARKEVNQFSRSYLHSWICERCCAQKKHKGWNPLMSYKNFHPSAAHLFTNLSDSVSNWM